MQAARIAELLSPFLDSSSDRNQAHSLLPQISTYIDILQRWNERINLTAIRDPEDIVTRHFGESFFAARHLFPITTHMGTAAPGGPAEQSSAPTASPTETSAHLPAAPLATSSDALIAEGARGRAALQRRDQEPSKNRASAPVTLADIGSGAGFPGLPIKLWAPYVSVTLIESNHKKVAFLREVARSLRLTDIDIQNNRAETLPKSSFQVVTLRAVEHFADILPVAASLLAPSGRLALLIGSKQSELLAAMLPNYTLDTPIPIPGSRSRVLTIARPEDRVS